MLLLLIVLLAGSVTARDLVLNEVMSNEPGSDKDLEWIEIFNQLIAQRNLSLYKLAIDDNTPIVLPSAYVQPLSYAVLCSNLEKYESVWGDNSGTWGDNLPLENYPAVELSDLNLVNISGTIHLINVALYDDTVSSFYWNSAGSDGVSWERVMPDSAEIRNCIEPSGSTPGQLNSITPQDNDLGIASVRFWPDQNNTTGFEIIIVNFGLNTMPDTTITVHYDLDHDSIVTNDDLLAFAYLPETSPGDSLIYTVYFELDGFLPYIIMQLPDDDQPFNNIWLHRVYGREYPTVILSEFLPDPTTSFGIEWVELKNRSDLDIDLQGWMLGDDKTFGTIADSEYVLYPGEYVVLCKDSTTLADYYGDNTIPIIEMSSWAILNNDEDMVRLKDNNGNIVDSLPYDHVFGGNVTWSRSEEPEQTDRWGWSVDEGGTPGRANEVYLQPVGTSIDVIVTPNPFSPRIDKEMTIEFEVPAGENITIKIYDLQGRVVKTLIDDLPAYDGQVVWRGDSDAGRRLKVGMYVLYMEVSGVDQYKQTIVIAP